MKNLKLTKLSNNKGWLAEWDGFFGKKQVRHNYAVSWAYNNLWYDSDGYWSMERSVRLNNALYEYLWQNRLKS